PPHSVARPRSRVRMLTFSPDGALVAGATDDPAAVLWDVAGRYDPIVLRGHKGYIADVAFSPDGALVATASIDHNVRVFDAHTAQLLSVHGAPWYMTSARFSPDGSYLAAATLSSDRQAVLYQVRGRREFRRLPMPKYGVRSVAFHPRLDRLASGNGEDNVVW